MIRTTAEHHFFTARAGWVPAGALERGDLFRGRDGRWVEVEAVEDRGEETEVYNLRVADFHTYFVGSEAWGFSVWAHNRYTLQDITNSGGPTADKTPARDRNPVGGELGALNKPLNIRNQLMNQTPPKQGLANQQTEKMGLLAAKQVARQLVDEANANGRQITGLKVFYQGKTGAGKSDLDLVMVYQENGKDKYLVIEAKGGSNSTQAREIQTGPFGGSGRLAQQGTREYLTDIVNLLQKPTLKPGQTKLTAEQKQQIKVGQALDAALRSGDLAYMKVEVKLDAAGQSVDRVSFSFFKDQAATTPQQGVASWKTNLP